MQCCSIAEISCGGYIDKARFHARTHIEFAPSAGKQQVEKIKISVSIYEKILFGYLSKHQKLPTGISL